MGSRAASAREKEINTAVVAPAPPLSELPVPNATMELQEKVIEINTYQVPRSESSQKVEELIQSGSADFPIPVCSVTGELRKNAEFLVNYVPLEELECDLFALCRDYREMQTSQSFSLESVELVHHLCKLQDISSDLSFSEKEGLLTDLNFMMAQRPNVVSEYRWTDRMLTFLSKLLVKWQLVDMDLYKYRNTQPPPVGRVQEQEYLTRQLFVLCLDTVWFACTCSHAPLALLIPQSLLKLALTLQTRAEELIKFAAELNLKVDFQLHPKIDEELGLESDESRLFLILKKPIKPEDYQIAISLIGKKQTEFEDLVSAKSITNQTRLDQLKRVKSALPKLANSIRKRRYAAAKKIGFHLLELPAVYCKCFTRDFHRQNVKMREMLVHFEQIYRVFEYEFLSVTEKLKEKEVENGFEDTISESVAIPESPVAFPDWVS